MYEAHSTPMPTGLSPVSYGALLTDLTDLAPLVPMAPSGVAGS